MEGRSGILLTSAALLVYRSRTEAQLIHGNNLILFTRTSYGRYAVYTYQDPSSSYQPEMPSNHEALDHPRKN